MPIQQCCVTPDEMRTIFHGSDGTYNQVVYTVPAGKVFVLTAWTMMVHNNLVLSVWLHRGTTRIAFSRIWDAARQHSHCTFSPGIAIAAGEQLVLAGSVTSMSLHLFYGYEQDV